MRHALDQPARIDEHQGSSVRFDLLGHPIVNRRPDVLADDRPQFFIRHLQAQFHFALMTGIDDGALGRPVGAYFAAAHQQPGDFLHRFLRCAESDSLQRPCRERRKPLHGQSEMGAALILRDRVNLVQDQGLGGFQEFTAARRCQ